jgi:hypothetical protein
MRSGGMQPNTTAQKFVGVRHGAYTIIEHLKAAQLGYAQSY